MHIKNETNKLISSRERTFIDQARREQIVRAAIELLAEEGYGRCSFVRLAARAGISVGVVAYHFENKAELIAQTVSTIYEMATACMLPRLEGETNAMGVLRAYIASNVEFIAGHPREMMALAEIFPNHRREDGKLAYDCRSEEPVLAALRGILEWGQKTGEFRAFHVEIMALTIRRAIDAIPPLALNNENFDVGVYALELTTLFEKAVQYS